MTIRPVDSHLHPSIYCKTVPNELLGMRLSHNVHVIQLLSNLFGCTKYGHFLDVFNDDPEKTYLAYRKTMYDFFGCHGKCVALPLDFKHNGGIDGKLEKDYTEQMEDLGELSKMYDEEIIVYDYATDVFPVRGVKVYPSLCGLLPEQMVRAHNKDFPIITHCEYGSVRKSSLSRKDAAAYNDPAHWLPVLKLYPELKLCFAHFGGEAEWKKHNEKKNSWVKTILSFVYHYENIYVDLSYAIIFPSVLEGVKKLLADNPWIKNRILFGTDYPMCVIEKDGLWRTLLAYDELGIWPEMADNYERFSKIGKTI